MSAHQLSVHELADQCGLALLYHGTFASPPAVLGKALQRDPGQSFYRYTKDPRNSSIRVCEMLDAFLEDEAPIEGCTGFYTQQTQELTAHPLVCYGSHSLHHYVLSSLNEDEQWREIDENSRFLKTLAHVQKTSVFPFRLAETGITMTRPSGSHLKQGTVRCCCAAGWYRAAVFI